MTVRTKAKAATVRGRKTGTGEARSTAARKTDPRTQTRSYIARLAPPARAQLTKLRDAIRSAAPEVEEAFSYGIPGFRLDGRPLVWYAAFSNHVGLYPMTASIRKAFAAELEGLQTSTGTIRFPLDAPLPVSLIKRL